jgi:hypothetical protein
MKAIDENCPAKAALRALSDEINDMHTDKRQYVDLINAQKQQIAVMREKREAEKKRTAMEKDQLIGDIEYYRDGYENVFSRWKHSEKITDQSIFAMFAVCVLSFVAIGCAVLMGWLW